MTSLKMIYCGIHTVLMMFTDTLPFVSQRQQKIQKDRLMNDFSAALNNFQVVQRRAAEKERESVARARAGTRLTVSLVRNISHNQP